MKTFNVKRNDREIVQTDLRKLNGKVIRPFYLSRFLCKNGNTAYTILFSIAGEGDTAYSAFVNDRRFIAGMKEYLDELGVDRASLTGENQQWFKVAVKVDEKTGFSFVYVNPM